MRITAFEYVHQADADFDAIDFAYFRRKNMTLYSENYINIVYGALSDYSFNGYTAKQYRHTYTYKESNGSQDNYVQWDLCMQRGRRLYCVYVHALQSQWEAVQKDVITMLNTYTIND